MKGSVEQRWGWGVLSGFIGADIELNPFKMSNLT